jgi:hypothetical protein
VQNKAEHSSNALWLRTWLWLLGIFLLVARVTVRHDTRRRYRASIDERVYAWLRTLQLAADRRLGKDFSHARYMACVPV